MRDVEIRDAERRLASGNPEERRADRHVVLSSLASALLQTSLTRLDRIQAAARRDARVEVPGLRPHHYDRKGRLIGLGEWAMLVESEVYKRVDATTLPNGLWVGTVWLGSDHGWGLADRPIIFETMVFPSETDMERCSTEEAAIQIHRAMCAKWQDAAKLEDGTWQIPS